MIRLATHYDIDTILSIMDSATRHLHSSGIQQWAVGIYPVRAHILFDITNCNGFVCQENGRIIGYCAVVCGEEPSYLRIYDGQWLTNRSYLTIHRVAVDIGCIRMGVAQQFMEFAKIMAKCNGCNIRIDTHVDNKPMLKLIDENAFTYCGLIHVTDETERLAFELQI